MSYYRPYPKPRPTPRKRFWSYVQKTPTCWLWTGELDRPGYGRFKIDGRYVQATHYAWRLHTGSDVPTGMEIDHLAGVCSNRSCVNPDHLEPVTRQENLRRRDAARNNRPTRGQGEG